MKEFSVSKKSQLRLKASVFYRSWGLGPLAVIMVLGIGCVPIRQYLPSSHRGDNHGGSATTTVFESPDDFKNLGKDAWKNEMEGIASWYGEDFNGRLTANGEVYDMYKFTAAHKTLPLGTVVKVTNLDNGKTVEVRINDRGPYVQGRIIDLSRTAGRAIGMREAGTAQVKLEVVHWPDDNH
jgi:rare lipoprotein A (peptidoglycan hydrolase)